MWGVHATISTRTDKFLLIKAYEIDFGFQYWIAYIYNLFELLSIIKFVVYAYYPNSDSSKTTSLKSIQHCRRQRNRKQYSACSKE